MKKTRICKVCNLPATKKCWYKRCQADEDKELTVGFQESSPSLDVRVCQKRSGEAQTIDVLYFVCAVKI